MWIVWIDAMIYVNFMLTACFIQNMPIYITEVKEGVFLESFGHFGS